MLLHLLSTCRPQALKIRSLEERNEELRCEAERLRALSGEMSHDRQDVFEHLERDNQAKAVALHDLTGQVDALLRAKGRIR